MKENPYQPNLATIESIKEEVGGERAIKTFRLKFQDKDLQKNFTFQPGQCSMVSLLGQGECMFAISSSPKKKATLK